MVLLGNLVVGSSSHISWFIGISTGIHRSGAQDSLPACVEYIVDQDIYEFVTAIRLPLKVETKGSCRHGCASVLHRMVPIVELLKNAKSIKTKNFQKKGLNGFNYSRNNFNKRKMTSFLSDILSN